MSDNPFKVFLTEKKGCVLWIYLNNPKKRNAMGLDFWEELPKAFQLADEDEEVRAVVLAAKGGHFCAGLDLMGLAQEAPMLLSGEAGGRPKAKFLALIHKMQARCAAPETCSKPVIAAVQGFCIGGGLDLIAAADIRLAAADAVFSLREAKVAMIADLGSLQRLGRIVGEGYLREMAYTAKDYTAEEAKAMRLVNNIYDDEAALFEAAQKLANEIGEASPMAVETTKTVLNYGRGRTVEEGLEYAAIRQIGLIPNPDLFEAIAAFGEKRKPQFGG